MGIISNSFKKASSWFDPAAAAIGRNDPILKSGVDYLLKKTPTAPTVMEQPVPGDPLIANDQARIAALAAQRSGRASTILSQPNSDVLGG